MSSAARTPVSLLTGFLGSGKTTLLNAWLRCPSLSDAAVIVNEFGEVGIDHALIASSNDNTIELSTGCLCCTVRGDLVDTLRGLAERRARGEIRPFSRVLIETTGLADPVPVIQALITAPVAGTYRLSRVITAVDGVQGLNTLERHREALKQAVVADELVLTKLDLEAGAPEALASRLRGLNPGAGVHRSRLGAPPPPELLEGADVYDPATKPGEVDAWLRAERYEHDDHAHADEIKTFSLSFDQPLHWEHVAAWLDALVIAHGEDLLRVKGILNIVDAPRPIVVQAVQRLFHPPAELPAQSGERVPSRIVFITRGLSRGYIAEVFATIRSKALCRL